MKIAIAGKGGVGKTTISALIALGLKDLGYQVLAIDADPDPNLALVLGFPEAEKITPVAGMKPLIAERMELNPQYPGWYKMNPEVSDLPEKFIKVHQGIKLIVMGTIERGASGCACPESTFLKRLLKEIVLKRNECIVVDFEAGLEHLGRATAANFDYLLVVLEPDVMSISSFKRIYPLAKDIGVKNIFAIINKIQNKQEINFVKKHFEKQIILGFLPYSQKCQQISRSGEWEKLRELELFSALRDLLGKLIK